MAKSYLAFDLGASSGRAIKGTLTGGGITLSEAHRFENSASMQNGALRWDIDALLSEIKRGIALAGSVESAGIDTWGVDFGLLDAEGRLLEAPYCYRDSLTEGAPEHVFQTIPREALYARTGIQIMPFNTLFQLYALQKARPELLAKAKTLLMTPNLLAYLLTGEIQCEYTIASTSQMLSAQTRAWDTELLSSLGIPTGLLPAIVQPGVPAGSYNGLPLVNVACHDTASAVAAVPAPEGGALFLSCGTWSLLGAEVDSPIITEASARENFTNEGGVAGTIRFLKNIMGLWIVQEARRAFPGRPSYAVLTEEAEAATPLQSFIDPDDPRFLPPGDMPGRIQAYCRETDQPVPQTRGEIVRCIYESLAMRYRQTVQAIGALTGKTWKCLHAVGGGIQAGMLMQLAADALQMPVVAGPTEATALGNLFMQMLASGEIASLPEARALLSRAVSPTVYAPRADMEKAFAHFETLCSNG